MAGEAVFAKKRHLNIVDIILILIILAAICALAYILVGNKLSPGSNYEVVYTVEVPIIKDDIVDEVSLLKQGDRVIDAVRSHQIGEIISVTIEPATQNITNMLTGIVTKEPYPEHSKLIFTVKSDCDKADIGYSIKGYGIFVGAQIHFRTEYLVNHGFCTSIKVTEKKQAVSAAQED